MYTSTSSKPMDWRSSVSMHADSDIYSAITPTARCSTNGNHNNNNNTHDSHASFAEDLHRAQRLNLSFRSENDRLRDQLKAQALREKYLMQRIQELSSSSSAAHSTPPQAEVEGCVPTTRQQLAARDSRIRELEVLASQLEGKLSAYEEVFQRGQASTTAATGGGTSASVGSSPPASSSSFPSAPPTHHLLCQCLSTAEYLVKVFNAAEHCQTAAHPQDCPRSQQACARRCLEASMKGNTETAGDMHARGYCIDDKELLLSLREVLDYCETLSVRLSAQMLSSHFETVSARSADAEKGEGEPNPPVTEAPAAQQQQQQQQAAQGGVSAAVASTRRRRAPAARVGVQDCQVQ